MTLNEINESTALTILKSLKVKTLTITSNLSINHIESINGFIKVKQAITYAYELSGAHRQSQTDENMNELTISAIKEMGNFDLDVDIGVKDPNFNRFKSGLNLVFTEGLKYQARSPKSAEHQSEGLNVPLFAVYQYAIKHGDYWKINLKSDWKAGLHLKEDGGQSLEELKEKGGDEWLDSFDIKTSASDGRLAHVMWETITEDGDLEVAVEIALSEMASALGADADSWWESWLERSDEWNALNQKNPDSDYQAHAKGMLLK